MAHSIDSNATLWKSVQALMVKQFGKPVIKPFALYCNVGVGTIQRIQEQETSVGLKVIDKIAARFGFEAWQLLVPDFDPNHPPQLQPSGYKGMVYQTVMTAIEALTAEEPKPGEKPAPSEP